MTGLTALVLGLVATAYAVWPALRGGAAPRLSEDDEDAAEEVEAAAAAVIEWSVASGEIHRRPDGGGNDG